MRLGLGRREGWTTNVAGRPKSLCGSSCLPTGVCPGFGTGGHRRGPPPGLGLETRTLMAVAEVAWTWSCLDLDLDLDGWTWKEGRTAWRSTGLPPVFTPALECEDLGSKGWPWTCLSGKQAQKIFSKLFLLKKTKKLKEKNKVLKLFQTFTKPDEYVLGQFSSNRDMIRPGPCSSTHILDYASSLLTIRSTGL